MKTRSVLTWVVTEPYELNKIMHAPLNRELLFESRLWK